MGDHATGFALLAHRLWAVTGVAEYKPALRLKFYSGNKVESESSPVFPGQHYLPTSRRGGILNAT